MAQNNKSNKNKQNKQAQQQQSGKKSAQQAASQNKKKQTGTDEKKCGCCKWVLGSFFLIALIAGALTYDTNVNGRGVFAQSATGKALKNAGLLPHVEKAWYVSMSSAARAYKWAEVNVPPYAKPFGELCCNLYKLARNAACNAFNSASSYITSKLPVVAAFLEQYVPGLPGHIEKFYTSAKEFVLTGFKAGLEIWNGLEFGPLSRENLARMANDTRNAALDYYYTFHKKVDAYAKLK